MTVQMYSDFKLTAERFAQLVPLVKRTPGTGLFDLTVDDKPGRLRVKQATTHICLSHLHLPEPVVVHQPAGAEEQWCVLPVAWMVRFAMKQPVANQHPLNLVMVPIDALSPETRCPAAELPAQCAEAIRSSRSAETHAAVRIIARARSAAHASYDEAVDELMRRLAPAAESSA